MESMQRVPKEILNMMDTLLQAGHRVYLVGGCVRDFLLGKTPNDWDLCTSALPEEMVSRFPHTVLTGMKHGTVTVVGTSETAEITTFRKDGDYTDHRRPDTVLFSDTLEEDLARRDFTVNAMAMDRHGKLEDPYGGRQDLQRKLLRCVGNPDRRFQEDALRMFRCLRFAAQLGFTIHPETLAALHRNAPLAAFVAPERIHVELEKTLCAEHPEYGVQMVTGGLLTAFLAANHAVDLTDLTKLPREPQLRWALFCHRQRIGGNLRDTEQFLRQLRLDRQTISSVSAGVALAETGLPETTVGLKQLLSRHGAAGVRCAAACFPETDGLQRVEAVIASGECYELNQLALKGGDLAAMGYRGTEIGAQQRRLLDWVIAHPEENTPQALWQRLEDTKHDGLE